MPVIRGARCLDLFAGSGAIGLEALSRGAGETVFVDKQRGVIKNIERHLQSLDAKGIVYCGDAMAYLQGNTRPYDLVFLDPPFRKGWLPRVIELLPAHLNPGAHIYAEIESGAEFKLSQDFEALKSKKAGQVSYHWLQYRPQ